jgi:PKHD-type hydroxylase
MLLRVPDVLPAAALAQCRDIVLRAPWADGNVTAGTQSAQVKNNRQLPEHGEAAAAARALVLEHLARSALFITAALPKKIFPPLFNRYDGSANAFGNHVDNAMRTVPGTSLHVRTDLSATLFLSDPDSYDGGELVVEHHAGQQAVKLPAGDLILYPASSVHRVQPVTRGTRLASFFWVESMVRGDDQRRLLFDLDLSIRALRAAHGDSDATVRLTGSYHNLLRMWADS